MRVILRNACKIRFTHGSSFMTWKLICDGVSTDPATKFAGWGEPRWARIQVVKRWNRSVLLIPRLRLD
jgi:hypothetical protein